MTDGPRDPFTVPPGAPSDPSAPVPGYGAGHPAVPPAGSVPVTPPPPGMPPLGPPYAAAGDTPPPPHYPQRPPEQWPATPALLGGGGPYGPMPPIRTGPDRSRVLIVGAIAVVLAVIVGVLVGESTSNDGTDTAAVFPRSTASTESSDSTKSTESSESTSSSSDDLDTVVADIEAFVERERGLKFKQRVKPRLAGEGEFQRLLLEDFDKARPGLVAMQEVLTATGLIDPGTDVVDQERSLLDVGVVGAYFPQTKELVVRGTKVTPYVREVLAHELTHALDDQWFNLDRPELEDANDDAGYAFLGLVEGNATRVEDAYLSSLSLDEQEQAFQEQQDLVAQHPEVADLPPI